MVKYHQKSIAAPPSWPLDRKRQIFTVRALPGGQPHTRALPIALFMKEVIKCAHTQKEVKYILHNKSMLINGRRVHDEKIPVGLFDTVELPQLKECYRVLLDRQGHLIAVRITDNEKNIKPTRICGKTDRNKEQCQVNSDDGRNILVKKKEAASYKVGDSLLIDTTTNTILRHLPCEPGSTLFFIGGKAIGKTGTLKECAGNKVVFATPDGDGETARAYAFVIGKEKPEITLSAK